MPDHPPTELDAAVDRLTQEFAGVHDRDTVERTVQRTHAELQPAKVETFLPLLVHRYAREALRDTTT